MRISTHKKIKAPLAELLSATLESFGSRWVKNRGECHGELMPNGSELRLEPFGSVQPRVGEMAAYLNPEGFEVVHRLCHRDNRGWWGNADTVLAMEPTGLLIGRVTACRFNGSTRGIRPLPGRARSAWLIHRLYHHSHGRLGSVGRTALKFIQRLKQRLYPIK